MNVKYQPVYCDYMKLKKGDYLYKEHEPSNGSKLCIVYKVEHVNREYVKGKIVWSKGNIYGWEEGRYLHNIGSSVDNFFTIVKKLREDEYLAKVL